MHDFIYPHSIDQGKADGMTIIDIRRPEEWAARALPQADMQVEMTDLLNDPAAHLEAGRQYLLVCAAGARTQHTAAILTQQGYDNVFAFPSAW